MKIAFFLRNNNLSDIDFSLLKFGNPGIGGSEYCICQVAYLLSLHHNVYLFCTEKTKLKNPSSLNLIDTDSVHEMIKYANQIKIDYLILKDEDEYYQNKDIESTPYTKIIIWCHNFLSRKKLSYYNNLTSIPRIVCVGNEQLDFYRDHPAFYKSCVIYNGLTSTEIQKAITNTLPFNKRANIITYIGSLTRPKGFHLLAKQWKRIIAKFPDAELYVIGGGNLYNKSQKLGIYNIAEETYEKIFIKYLIDEKTGKILPSVHFCGVLGSEKNQILAISKVGVPNPSGETETFCITALEMQIYGCLVTTKRFGGFLDTICSSKSLMYNYTSNLSRNIIKLLSEKDNNIEETISNINNKFNYDKIIPQWLLMFKEIAQNELPNISIIRNGYYNNKWIKEILRLTKNIKIFQKIKPTPQILSIKYYLNKKIYE